MFSFYYFPFDRRQLISEAQLIKEIFFYDWFLVLIESEIRPGALKVNTRIVLLWMDIDSLRPCYSHAHSVFASFHGGPAGFNDACGWPDIECRNNIAIITGKLPKLTYCAVLAEIWLTSMTFSKFPMPAVQLRITKINLLEVNRCFLRVKMEYHPGYLHGALTRTW